MTQTLAQHVADLILLPFQLTLFFMMAPFRIAKWGINTGRAFAQYFLGFAPQIQAYLVRQKEKLEAKKPAPVIISQKSFPTLKSVKKSASVDKSTQSEETIYEDFLSGLRHSIESAKDPQARVDVLKQMLESSQDTAMQAANTAIKQTKDLDEIKNQYLELNKAYADLSMNSNTTQEELVDEQKKSQKLAAKISELEKLLAKERQEHQSNTRKDKLLLLQMEKDLIQEKKQSAETKEKFQVANLELMELTVREEQNRRAALEDLAKEKEIAQLRMDLSMEKKIQKELRRSASMEQETVPQQTSTQETSSDASAGMEKPHHEFDLTHLSFKDAVMEVAPHDPHHHEFDPSHFSYKNALLEPTPENEERMDNSSAPEAQASF